MTDPILRKYLLMASLASSVMLGGSAAAQQVEPAIAQIPPGEITLFSGSNFNAVTFVVNGPRAILTVPFRVRSVRMRQGRPWELCSRTQYRDCQTFNGPVSSISLTVASARPVQPQIQPPIVGGRSLRGMAAEFFPAPTNQQGVRVDVPNANANAAAQRADRFCTRVGWNGSAYQRLETVRGRVYLADVLCVRSGF